MPKEINNVEVFKAGTHTDSAGNQHTYSVEDLQAIADKYNNQPDSEKHIAPAVIGHPVTDSPAYGWVKDLQVVGEKLVANFYDVADEFVDWLEKGLYKTRSISLSEDMMLRHIGWLGAVPPAVKGLAEVKFSHDSSKFLIFNYADQPQQVNPDEVALMDRSKKWGIQGKMITRVVREEVGVPQKPPGFENVPEEGFADPVNFRFPINDKASLVATLREGEYRWGDYTDEERLLITKRIAQAMIDLGITESDKDVFSLYFSEFGVNVNPEILSKKQLLQVLSSSGQTNDNKENQSLNPKQEFSMDEQKLQEMFASLLAFIKETFGEETANQISAKIDELMAASAPQPTGGNEPPAPAPSNNSEAIRSMMNRIKVLEAANQLMEFNEYFNSQVNSGQLVPAQRAKTQALFEAVRSIKAPVNFSEDGTQVQASAHEVLKGFISSFPAQVKLAEFATRERVGNTTSFSAGDEENPREVLHNKTLKLMSEREKAGKGISYAEALNIVQREMTLGA